MSYILNALRKSERERQAIEPDTVTDRIIVHQPPRHQSSTKLVAALVVINLAFLVYFFGFTQKTSPEATQTVAAVKPVEASRTEISSRPRPAAKPPAPKKPPIAEIADAKIAAPAVLPPVRPAAIKQALIEPVKPVLASPPPVIQKAEPVKDAEKPVPEPLKSDLPFLDELPSDFRRSLPDLPINVFSYSSTPAERFVMIDMVKYIPGQRIKDLLELKEIRPDSIVVNYNDRTFKIKRP